MTTRWQAGAAVLLSTAVEDSRFMFLSSFPSDLTSFVKKNRGGGGNLVNCILSHIIEKRKKCCNYLAIHKMMMILATESFHQYLILKIY